MAERDPKPISLSAYAKHRGVSVQAVSMAVKEGRLEGALVIVKTRAGKEMQKIISLAAGDREWASNTQPSAADPATEEEADVPDRLMSWKEARRRKEIALGQLAAIKVQVDQLDLEVKQGGLIDIDKAREDVQDEYIAVRTKLMGLPKRLQQRIPAFTSEMVELSVSLVREVLEELSGDE